MIVNLFSFDKMINFTFSVRLRLVDLLVLYAPAYFFTNRVMYARQQMLQFYVATILGHEDTGLTRRFA